MAEYDNNKHIGPFLVEPNADRIDTLRRYDKALGSPAHDAMHDRPASYYAVTVSPGLQVPSGGAASSMAIDMPWPATLLAVDIGCQVHGGSLTVLTGDVLVEPAAGGGFVPVLDAVEDILAPGAGVNARVAPEDGSEELAFGDKVRVTWAATTDTADGAQATLYFKKL